MTSLNFYCPPSSNTAHTNYYYPVSSGTEGDTRWDKIVRTSLNKCRGCRKKIKEAQKKGDDAIESDNSDTEN